ncbi:MAG: hypothetical protein O2962_04535 [Cyanobacteria bacterium]|nr:hypothetical protein [Cyanobacteriota bacterium]
MQVGTDCKIARFWTRFAAFYLNLFLILVAAALIEFVLIKLQIPKFELWTREFYIHSAKIVLAVFVFDSIIQGIITFNLSKFLLGLRLYDSHRDASIGLIRSLIRSVIAIFSVAFFGLGYLAIGFNLDAKSLHDLLISTKVVRIKQNIIGKIVTGFIQILSILFGLILTLALLASLALLPYLAAKSFYSMNLHSHVESTLLRKNLEVKLPISNNQLTALADAKSIDYIEFELNDYQVDSCISEASLAKLGLSLIDYNLRIEDLDFEKIKPSVVIPALTFKDVNKQDIKVFNQQFIVTKDQDQLGTDLLETWDYRIDHDQSLLSLKLYEGDADILANQELDDDSRNYLVYILRKTRLDWDKHLRFMPANELKKFTESKVVLENVIKFDLDTKTGYVDHISLEKPSKSEAFNKFCQRFFEELDRFRLVPKGLVEKSKVNLSLILRYKETI